jgi:hypothetical protein
MPENVETAPTQLYHHGERHGAAWSPSASRDLNWRLAQLDRNILPNGIADKLILTIG